MAIDEESTAPTDEQPMSQFRLNYDQPDTITPTNRIATVGAVLCVFPLVGLVLSVIGLFRAKSRGNKGKTVATIGIALSLLFAGGYTAGVYLMSRSTASDPGCVAAEAAANVVGGNLADTVQQMNSDALAPAYSSDVITAEDQIQTLKSMLDSDVGKATHASVRTQLQAIDDDFGIAVKDYLLIADGNQAGYTDLQSHESQILSDAAATDSLCFDFTNG